MNRKAFEIAFSWEFVKRSIVVALIVGTVLTAINQGNALFGEAIFRPWIALLTYCVPFFVSSFGVYSSLATSSKASPFQTKSLSPPSYHWIDRPLESHDVAPLNKTVRN